MNSLKNITEVGKAVCDMSKQLTDNFGVIEERLAPYKNGVVTEDTLAPWKKDRATLAKEKKSYNDERILLEKGWKEKIAPVTDAYKQIDAMYAGAIANIDSQTKLFEDARKAEKKAIIKEVFESIEQPECIKGWIGLYDIYDSKWENATCTVAQIKKAMEQEFEALQLSYDTLKAMNHEFEEIGIAWLKQTRSLKDAIVKMNEAVEIKKITEAKKAEPVKEAAEDPYAGFYETFVTFEVKVPESKVDEFLKLVKEFEIVGEVHNV